MKRIFCVVMLAVVGSVVLIQAQDRGCIFGGRPRESKNRFLSPMYDDTVKTNAPTIAWQVPKENEVFLIVAPCMNTLEETLTKDNVVIAEWFPGVDSINMPYLDAGDYIAIVVWDGSYHNSNDVVKDVYIDICKICPECCVGVQRKWYWDPWWKDVPIPLFFTVNTGLKSHFVSPTLGDTVKTNTPTISWDIPRRDECFLIIAPCMNTLEETLTKNNVVVAEWVSGVDSITAPHLDAGDYIVIIVSGDSYDDSNDVVKAIYIDICRICPECCRGLMPKWTDPWEPWLKGAPSPLLFTVSAEYTP